MRSLMLLSEKFIEHRDAVILKRATLKLHGNNYGIALVESPAPGFFGKDAGSLESVLVRKIAFSVNFRDIALLSLFSKHMAGNIQAPAAMAFGSEFVAEVVAIGAGVTNLKVGDRVIPNGAYPGVDETKVKGGLPTNQASAEYEVFHQLQLIVVPPGISDAVAAAFTIGAQTSYCIKRRLIVNEREKVLIVSGTSNTSLFCINALAGTGANLTVLTAQHRRVPELLKQGAHEVFVVEDRSDPAGGAGLTQLRSRNLMFDAVIDPFSDLHLSRVIDLINMNGRYITCGLYNQTDPSRISNIEPFPFLYHLITKNLSVIGNCLGNTDDLLVALDDHQRGKLNVIIDSVYDESNIQLFLEQAFSNKDRFGKVVFFY